MSNRKRSTAAKKERAKARRAAAAPQTEQSRKPGQPPSRRRRSRRMPWATLAGVLLVVGAMVVLFVSRGQPTDHTSAPSASASAIAKALNVPASTLTQVGVPTDITARALPSGTPPVTIDGKPAIVYIGAEYCPYCAAERWPVVVALSRFGTFTDLGSTTSSSTDVYPDTPTFTFHGATYLSPYVAFSPVETQTRTGAPLDTPTPEQQRLLDTYNVAAVTGSDGAIPFVMVGNRYAWAGASYGADVLTGKSFEQIANALADPASPIAQGIDGTANQITAMICQLTGDQPADVCGTPSIQQAQSSLPSA